MRNAPKAILGADDWIVLSKVRLDFDRLGSTVQLGADRTFVELQ